MKMRRVEYQKSTYIRVIAKVSLVYTGGLGGTEARTNMARAGGFAWGLRWTGDWRGFIARMGWGK